MGLEHILAVQAVGDALGVPHQRGEERQDDCDDAAPPVPERRGFRRSTKQMGCKWHYIRTGSVLNMAQVLSVLANSSHKQVSDFHLLLTCDNSDGVPKIRTYLGAPRSSRCMTMHGPEVTRKQLEDTTSGYGVDRTWSLDTEDQAVTGLLAKAPSVLSVRGQLVRPRTWPQTPTLVNVTVDLWCLQEAGFVPDGPGPLAPGQDTHSAMLTCDAGLLAKRLDHHLEPVSRGALNFPGIAYPARIPFNLQAWLGSPLAIIGGGGDAYRVQEDLIAAHAQQSARQVVISPNQAVSRSGPIIDTDNLANDSALDPIGLAHHWDGDAAQGIEFSCVLLQHAFPDLWFTRSETENLRNALAHGVENGATGTWSALSYAERDGAFGPWHLETILKTMTELPSATSWLGTGDRSPEWTICQGVTHVHFGGPLMSGPLVLANSPELLALAGTQSVGEATYLALLGGLRRSLADHSSPGILHLVDPVALTAIRKGAIGSLSRGNVAFTIATEHVEYWVESQLRTDRVLALEAQSQGHLGELLRIESDQLRWLKPPSGHHSRRSHPGIRAIYRVGDVNREVLLDHPVDYSAETGEDRLTWPGSV